MMTAWTYLTENCHFKALNHLEKNRTQLEGTGWLIPRLSVKLPPPDDVALARPCRRRLVKQTGAQRWTHMCLTDGFPIKAIRVINGTEPIDYPYGRKSILTPPFHPIHKTNCMNQTPVHEDRAIKIWKKTQVLSW